MASGDPRADFLSVQVPLDATTRGLVGAAAFARIKPGACMIHLSPRGVGVVIEAEHSCMTLRGVRAPGTRTVTSALLGLLRTHPSSRAEFLALTRGERAR